MTDHADRFGELRSILQRSPDPQTWGAICALLDQWPQDASLVEQALPYCEAHMRAWQDGWRVAPKRWITRLFSGESIPALALARRIRVHIQLPDRERVRPLLDHPVIATLTQLDLSNTQIDEHAAYDVLNTISQHNRLEHLNLSYNDQTYRAIISWLTDARTVPPLKHLHIANIAPISHLRSLNYFFDALNLSYIGRSLKSLNLSFNLLYQPHIGISSLRSIIHFIASAPQLQDLHLDRCFPPFNDTTSSIFKVASWPSTLEALSLSHNDLDELFIDTLHRTPRLLGRLTVLSLRDARLTDARLSELLAPLRGRQQWQLETLDLSNNDLSDDSVDLLLELPWIGQLRALDLSSTHISDAGALALISAPQLHPHVALKLHGNGFGDITHAAIAASAALRSELQDAGEAWRSAALDPDDPWWLA